MLAQARVINILEAKPKNFCSYKGIKYFVERENTLSKIYIKDEEGKIIEKNCFRKYIIVDRQKLYLDYKGENVCAKQPGKSSSVDFLTTEEVNLMKDIFKNKIKEATTPTNEIIAWKNYTMFFAGINVGLRASDLRRLQWKHVYNDNGDYKDGWWFKSKKTDKDTKIKFNKTFLNSIKKYREKLIELKGVPHREDYLFFSKKNERQSIKSATMWKILHDIAEEAGIRKDIGSHTLRKTFGRNMYEFSKDKERALVMLAEWFRHSDTKTTRIYIGITDEDKQEFVDTLDGVFGEM